MRTRPSRRISAATLAATALLAAGCSSSHSSASAPSSGGSTPAAASSSPAAAAFPATVTAKNGAVKIAAAPKRIVSLSPTATEDLHFVGADSQVVAVDDQSDFPATMPKTALSGYKPDAEAIAKYNPDLVIVADDSAKIVEQLTKLGVPVLWFDAAASLDDAYGQITQIGAATGHADTAAAAVADMKAKITAAIASVKKPATPLKYYYEVGTAPYYGATSKTFIGSILAQMGLTNIADAADKAGSGYPQLSDEAIVTAAPDLVFLADAGCCQQSAATVAARPGWSAVPAVKNSTAKGTVLALNDDEASRWTPRLADVVQAIAAEVNKAQG